MGQVAWAADPLRRRQVSFKRKKGAAKRRPTDCNKLEVNLRSELCLATRSCRGNAAEVRAGNGVRNVVRTCRVVKLSVIEHVIAFQSELNVFAVFISGPEVDVLEDREICVVDSGTV